MKKLHYPSLELCKKLTEIGFPETELYYLADGCKDEDWFIGSTNEPNTWFNYFCPSVMEMLDVMPSKIEFEGMNYFLTIAKENQMKVSYEISSSEYIEYFATNELPNAIAEMLLWLHENNYISFTK